MQIVCVSRGTFEGGRRLARSLADMLGYECVSREDLTDAATGAGIPVGRIEMAVVRLQPLTGRLVTEIDRYRAFVLATLCEKLLDHSIVYHGRAGHLVFEGVTQALRVRVIQDAEQRLVSTMERLGLSSRKARKYIEQVDEDRRRWVRALYGVDWNDPAHYDTIVNLSYVNIENAARGLLGFAQLPDFQITPACERRLRDTLLAARCRLAIGADPRTRDLEVKVQSERGEVWVTYLPQQARLAEFLPEVLAGVPGVEKIHCTLATTNILWIQERFDPESEYLPQIQDLANRWNAAVELVQIGGGEAVYPELPPEVSRPGPETPDGGILPEEAADGEERLDPGLRSTHAALSAAGRAGGCRVVCEGPRPIVGGLDRGTRYSLVIVGDVYLSKGEAPRKRLTRELMSSLSEKLRVPVIGAEDLKSQYFFGPAQLRQLLVSGALAAALVALLFGNEGTVLEFMSREGTGPRILATVALLAFAPLFASLYGNFTRMLLRLLRFE